MSPRLTSIILGPRDKRGALIQKLDRLQQQGSNTSRQGSSTSRQGRLSDAGNSRTAVSGGEDNGAGEEESRSVIAKMLASLSRRIGLGFETLMGVDHEGAAEAMNRSKLGKPFRLKLVLVKLMHGVHFAESLSGVWDERWKTAGQCPSQDGIDDCRVPFLSASLTRRQVMVIAVSAFASVTLVTQSLVALIGGKWYVKSHRWVNLAGLAVCGASRIFLIVLSYGDAMVRPGDGGGLNQAIVQNILAIGFSLASHEVREDVHRSFNDNINKVTKQSLPAVIIIIVSYLFLFSGHTYGVWRPACSYYDSLQAAAYAGA